jgi:hypothetical protein
MAAEGGQSQFVKVLYGLTASEVHRQAAVVEQRKGSGELEVFQLVDDTSYGYAPAGLVEASEREVERIRTERLHKEWDESTRRIEKRKADIAARMEKLERRYGPAMAALVDKLEVAVDRYIASMGRDTAQVAKVKEIEQSVGRQVGRQDKGLRAAIRVFVKELTDVPKLENPQRGGSGYKPDLVGMAWNFVPGSALIDEELRMLGRERRRR